MEREITEIFALSLAGFCLVAGLGLGIYTQILMWGVIHEVRIAKEEGRIARSWPSSFREYKGRVLRYSPTLPKALITFAVAFSMFVIFYAAMQFV